MLWQVSAMGMLAILGPSHHGVGISWILCFGPHVIKESEIVNDECSTAVQIAHMIFKGASLRFGMFKTKKKKQLKG